MLSVIVLSFNRREALRRTLAELSSLGPRLGTTFETIVVDNASTDGTQAMVADEFPTVRLVALAENVGVAAFNRGGEIAGGDVLLILDDDSWPDGDSLVAAMALLADNAGVAGVALSPIHPRTRVAEWPFLTTPRSRWPVMGCGNLVRTRAWHAVGGYEESFFLYRNDTDLAMKLLAAGFETWADPSWIVWHDSPHAARKSDRWLDLATRNWVWLARRHARGWRLPFAIALGWAWACRHAGVSPRRLGLVTRGTWHGLTGAAHPMLPAIQPDGTAFAELLRLQVASKRRSVPAHRAPQPAESAAITSSSIPRHSP